MFESIKSFIFGLFNIDKKEYNYNNKLIKTLEKQHKGLFKTYNYILTNAKKRKYSKVIDGLEELKKMYTTHILIEDNKLYTYLEKVYKDKDQSVYNFIHSKQEEMKVITNNLLKFLEKYETDEDLKNDIENFVKTWEEIGKLLTKRIEMEQTNLYPLYKKENGG